MEYENLDERRRAFVDAYVATVLNNDEFDTRGDRFREVGDLMEEANIERYGQNYCYTVHGELEEIIEDRIQQKANEREEGGHIRFTSRGGKSTFEGEPLDATMQSITERPVKGSDQDVDESDQDSSVDESEPEEFLAFTVTSAEAFTLVREAPEDLAARLWEQFREDE